MAFMKQRFKTDCGVAALAILCNVMWEEARDAIVWPGRRYYTTTKQLREAAILLGFTTKSTLQNRLRVITVPVDWYEHPYTSTIWSLIPDNSLVKIPGRHSWHWVVWRNGKVYDPARGVFKPEKVDRIPSSYMQFIRREN